MLNRVFSAVYDKFKLNFYRSIFSGFEDREASLTTLETFCVEVIHALDRPTLNELTNFLNVSQPNAAYKVSNLVKKGYVNKVQSEEDKREYYLEVTDRFYQYYYAKNAYIDLVLERLREKFSEDKMQVLEEILSTMNEELMPEVTDVMRKEAYGDSAANDKARANA